MSCDIVKADTIFLSRKIYTVTLGVVCGGIAVKDGKIIDVQSYDKIRKYSDKNTMFVDYGDMFIMPGFIDGYTHMILQEKIPTTKQNIKDMFEVWTRYGVTSVNAMDFNKDDESAFEITRQLNDDNELNVRVFASLDAAYASDESIEKAKSYMNSDMFRLYALKAFMDGNGSGHTAFMKRCYADANTRGCCYLEKEKLLGYLKLASKHSLAMHTHTCGDAAIATALDAYKQARDEGVELDLRFSVEHLDTIDNPEISLLSELNISANLTPDCMAPTERFSDNPYLHVYDTEDANKLWRFKTILNNAHNVSFGTDFTASSMNPFVQLYRALTRKSDDGFPQGGYHPEEKLNLKEAIYCYTMGSAKSIGMENKLGSIASDKYADFIVLDRDITKVSLRELRDTKVLATVVNGKEVFVSEEYNT